MGIINIGDLETATGTQIASGNEPRYQWYIDVVSAYIEDYTGQTFSTVVAETQLVETDRRGAVEYPAGLNSVTSVSLWDPWLQTYTALISGDYAFDGIGTIYGLVALKTYKVVVSYGWSVVPVAIQGVATDLVLAGSGLAPGSTGGLRSYRVGDVEESYGVTINETGKPVVTVAGLQSAVLDKYSVNAATTWRL